MSEIKYDLFFNYSRADLEAVQLLASELSDAGVHVWLDHWELVPGQDWSQFQMQAMQQSRAIGICIGPKKTGRLDEQGLSPILSLRQRTPPCIIIPILLPDSSLTNIPLELAGEVCIDFREGIKSHQGISKLIGAILREEALNQLATGLEEGNRLRDSGDLRGTLGSYEQALSVALVKFGSEHPVVATVRDRIGSIQQELGNLKKARQEFEQALAIDTFAYGASHSRVARDWNNLGRVLVDLGYWSDAQACYERALRIEEATYDLAHPRIAIILSNLGSLLKDRGDLAGAKHAFERALAIDTARFGPNHLKVATDHNNLGGVLRDLVVHSLNVL
jgi:tetratricopeptide (TPR) repeat protein